MNKVAQLRKQQKMSQSELAAKVGISRTFLSTIETGAANPTLPVAQRIAQALGQATDTVFPKP